MKWYSKWSEIKRNKKKKIAFQFVHSITMKINFAYVPGIKF